MTPLLEQSLAPTIPERSRADGPISQPGVSRTRDAQGNLVLRVIDDAPIPAYDVVTPTLLFELDNKTLTTRIAGRRVFAILDGCVNQHYGDLIRDYLARNEIDVTFHVLDSLENSECNKSNDSCMQLHAALVYHGFSSGDVILGIGGGVVSDLVGFVASTHRRGLIPYLIVTTTLTATIDAGISPKTAINVAGHKNLCGTVYPPEAVMTDLRLLATDPALKTGLAELIKLSIVRDRDMFEQIEQSGHELLVTKFQSEEGCRLIGTAQYRFLAMKFEPPCPGNRPASLRAFGHSFSRRLEELSGFGLTHGEAISIEMAVAANLAVDLHQLEESERERIIAVLADFDLLVLSPECTEDRIWPVFARRFDAGKRFWFPIPLNRIGSGNFLSSFTKSDLRNAIAGVPRIRQRLPVEGRVEYRVREHDTSKQIMADFSLDRPTRFLECDPWEERGFPCRNISDDESTFAYRLLTRRLSPANVCFDRDMNRVVELGTSSKCHN